MSPRPPVAKELPQRERLIDCVTDVHAGVEELTAGFARKAAHIPEMDWPSTFVAPITVLRQWAKKTSPLAAGLNLEAFATIQAPAVEVGSVLDRLAVFWPDVGSRVREIRSALREDFDCDLHPRSLKTLNQVLQQVPHVPQPRIGAGDDGTLDAIWTLGDTGIFTAEFLADGMVGCAAVLNRGEPSYSETLEVRPACALLSCLARLRLLLERR